MKWRELDNYAYLLAGYMKRYSLVKLTSLGLDACAHAWYLNARDTYEMAHGLVHMVCAHMKLYCATWSL